MLCKLKGCVRNVRFCSYLTKKEKIILIVSLVVSYSLGAFLTWYIIGLYGISNGGSLLKGSLNFWMSLEKFWEDNPLLVIVKLITVFVFFGCLGYPFFKKVVKKI